MHASSTTYGPPQVRSLQAQAGLLTHATFFSVLFTTVNFFFWLEKGARVANTNLIETLTASLGDLTKSLTCGS